MDNFRSDVPVWPSLSRMTWRVPGYAVETLIGHGGSGEVWRGRETASGRPVALKRLPVSGPGQLQAARAEAALLSALDHPHLVGLHELVPVADEVVLVLDLAAGGSLADLLARRGRLAPGEAISALAPIGAALAYAHNEGVVHGDVSAGNVVFTETGFPMLADLGVARIVGDAAPARSTPAYVDPAVAAGCAPGAASDVFMLAAVALHAVSGTPVWPGSTAEEMLARAASGDLGDLDVRLAGLPPEMAALLGRALALEPCRRCTAGEFALDLRHTGPAIPIELSAGRAAREVASLADRSEVPHVNRPHGGESADRESQDGQSVGAVESPGSAKSPAADPPDGKSPTGPALEAPSDLARPAFPRPGLDVPLAGPGELTHGVRAALRISTPTGQRSRVRRLTQRRRGLLAACVIAMAAVAAGAVVVISARHGDAAAPPAPSAPTSGSLPGPASSASGAPAAEPSGVDALAAVALRQLDESRAQAFARRDPALLQRVYVAGPLLAQDTVLLERIVPLGCGLVGVHTRYVGVAARAVRSGLTVEATAILAPSTLTCRGHRSATAAGAGPARLRIMLVRQDNGYRIASQQRRPATR